MSYAWGMLSYDTYPLVLQALDLISQGRTRSKACETVGLTVRTFVASIRADRDLMAMLEESNILGDDALFDALLDPEVNPLIATTDPKKLKVYSDNIKWVLERRNRERFGQQVSVKQEVTIGFAITDELEKARRRSQLALPPVDYIDAEFVEVTDDEDISSLLGVSS